ncbi:acyl-CoA dehydrogenase, partial [Streptomyces sp. NPDC048279]
GSQPPRDRTPVAGRRAFLLGERYVLVLAAAACLGVSRAAGSGDPFLADPLWVTAALRRLAEHLGLRPGPLPDPAAEAMFEELTERHRGARTFDMFRTGLATPAGPDKGVD